MSALVTSDVLRSLAEEAHFAHPDECCGILLGYGLSICRLLPARNVHPTPDTHFEIDPQALVNAHRAARDGGPQVVGYYHSHPQGRAAPSPTDAQQAAHDGRIWAIVGQDGDVTFWRDGETGFEAVSYCVTSD